jgi:hypothetical protein
MSHWELGTESHFKTVKQLLSHMNSPKNQKGMTQMGHPFI